MKFALTSILVPFVCGVLMVITITALRDGIAHGENMYGLGLSTGQALSCTRYYHALIDEMDLEALASCADQGECV
jgi:hypothetical protein